MKYLKIIISLIFTVNGYSQIQIQNNFNTLNEKLFEIKKPEVSGLLKFGEIPVNLFKGSPNINIPIFNHSGKKMSVSASLNYDSSGIKVDQLASWVGLGWNLNVGGVVNRKVQGLPDDFNQSIPAYISFKTIGDFMTNFNPLVGHIIDNPSAYRYNIKMQEEGLSDIQRDSYNYYAGSIKGTIVIDYNNNTAIDLENSNNKIEIIFDNISSRNIIGWKITDDQGNKYFFNKIEKTQHEFSSTFGTSVVNDAFLDYNSSWYLTKIESSGNEDKYDFEYTNSVLYNQFMPNKSYTSIDSYDTAPLTRLNNFALLDWIFDFEVKNLENQYSKYKISDSYLANIKYNGKTLADFHLSDDFREDLPNQKRLSLISVYEGDSNVFRKNYSFKCSYYNNNQPNVNQLVKRNKLDELNISTGIVLLNTTNPDSQTYKFEYNSNELPPRFAFSQDYWGYYNNQTYNNSLVPRWSYNSNFPELMGADRIPNLKSLDGLLSKITYPTKGYTVFDFEMHGFSGKVFQQDRNLRVDLAGNSGGFDNNNLYNYNLCDDIGINPSNRPVEGESKIYIPQDGTYTFRTEYSNNNNLNTSNIAPILWAGMYQSSELDDCVPITLSNGLVVQLCPNNYNFCNLFNNSTTNIFYQNAVSFNPPSQFNLTLTKGYYKILTVNNTSNSFYIYRNEVYNGGVDKGAGSRIKSISNYDFDDKLLLKKEYYYDDLIEKNINPSTIPFAYTALFNTDFKITDLFRKYTFRGPRSLNTNPIIFRRYSNFINDNDIATLGYEKVSEIYKDEFDNTNGFKVFQFNIESNPDLVYTQYLLNNNIWRLFNQLQPDLLRGTLLSEKSYDSNKILLSSSENFYKHTLESHLKTLDVKITSPTLDYSSRVITKENGLFYYKVMTEDLNVLSPVPLLGPDFCVNSRLALTNNINANVIQSCVPGPLLSIDYNVKKYFKSNLNLEKTINKNYFGNNIIIEEENNVFNNFNNLTSKKKFTNTNETLETKYFYPDDLIAEPLMNDLKTANRIGTPIKTESWKNGVKLSEQKTQFAKDASTSNLLLPKSVYTAKFPNTLPTILNIGNLEKKITFNQYDDKGNINQYTPENGIPISLIWGYNKTQPLAKIENAVYSSIPVATIANLQSLSDTGTEANLILALNALRNSISNAMITTYTHKPLIGVSTITDAKGDQINYYYDTFNRLQNVKDKNGNILTENQYNYRP